MVQFTVSFVPLNSFMTLLALLAVGAKESIHIDIHRLKIENKKSIEYNILVK